MLNKSSKQASFFYGSGSGFSGQRFAIELIAQGMSQRNWQVKIVTTPLRDRVKYRNRAALTLEQFLLMCRLFIAWFKGLRMVFTSKKTLISPGQTKFALIRDGLPLLVKGLFARNNPVVLSLHGNLMMNWSPTCFEAKVLRSLVQAAQYIAVLGPNQKSQLVRLGMPATKIIYVDNTCSIVPITEPELVTKHSEPAPIKILYLSSLIESKGYPEFVEAVAKLSQETTFPIQVVLCGKITVMDDDDRFKAIDQAKLWLETQINQINQSKLVQLQWINGAIGEIKDSLFKEAHIFVLPSRYTVETQPITIIEALASGCAIITTKVGEIPSTVSNDTAELLNEASAETISQAIMKLQHNSETRKRMAVNGLKLFKDRFTFDKHIDRWEQILSNMEANKIYGD